MMRSASGYVVVLVTAPDMKAARGLAQLVLAGRVAACVNLVSKVESHFWWQGKIERSAEVLMVLKTDRQCVPRLEKLILSHHPYDTPEIITVRLDRGNAQYLAWLSGSLREQ